MPLLMKKAPQMAAFEPIIAVERELVLRLATLLWRLRRATSMLNLGKRIMSTPTPVDHRTASRTNQKPGPTPGRNTLIPLPRFRHRATQNRSTDGHCDPVAEQRRAHNAASSISSPS